jgi:tetratricopeptide (TPR) repeat protein
VRADEATLAKARAAFAEADFDGAADAYNVAIDKGGLAPNELAECFLSVGISLASQGKTKKALDAFRLAVIVDPNVAFPPTGPKKAKPLLEQARKEMAKRAGDWFRVAYPERSIAIGTVAATVRVRLDAVAGLEAIEVDARSGEGDPWVQRLPLQAESLITLPRELHKTGRVRLRIAALDDVGNRWGELVRTIDVERTPDLRTPPTVAVAEPEPPPTRRRRRESATARGAATNGEGGFWSSPWPWVAIGTVAIGLGGAYAFALLDTSVPARVAAPTVTIGP